MAAKLDSLKKPVKIILATGLILVGFLFLVRPIVASVVATYLGAIVLMVAGAVEFVYYAFLKQERSGALPAILSSLLMAFGGILVLLLYYEIIPLLPLLFAIWLLAFGVLRVIQAVRRKEQNRSSILGIGILAIAGGIIMMLVSWTAGVDMIGILVAGIALIYGFFLLMGAIAKPVNLTDDQIANEMNEPYNEYTKKLQKKKRHP